MKKHEVDFPGFGLVWTEAGGWVYIIPEELHDSDPVPKEANILIAIYRRLMKEQGFAQEMLDWLNEDLRPKVNH